MGSDTPSPLARLGISPIVANSPIPIPKPPIARATSIIIKAVLLRGGESVMWGCAVVTGLVLHRQIPGAESLQAKAAHLTAARRWRLRPARRPHMQPTRGRTQATA